MGEFEKVKVELDWSLHIKSFASLNYLRNLTVLSPKQTIFDFFSQHQLRNDPINLDSKFRFEIFKTHGLIAMRDIFAPTDRVAYSSLLRFSYSKYHRSATTTQLFKNLSMTRPSGGYSSVTAHYF